jgi:hypothetical protein
MSSAANTGCTNRNQQDTNLLHTFTKQCLSCVRHIPQFIPEYYTYIELSDYSQIKNYYKMYFGIMCNIIFIKLNLEYITRHSRNQMKFFKSRFRIFYL